MENFTIFIIEDDPWYGEILEYHLSLNPDYVIHRFATAKEALSQLHLRPNLVTIDYSLPDMNGIELYKEIRRDDNDVPVIVISGQDDIAVALTMLKLGIHDYFIKDDNTKDLLWNAIINIRKNQDLKREVDHLKEELTAKYDFGKSIKGQSPALKKVFALMGKAAKTNINVSISGETGTGKELVAKAIHYNSDRKKKKFIAVNMAAIPRELVESELFGHEKGAFTGAIARKAGKFEEANGGTVFLDEIGELDTNIQSKVLRVLQEREVVRIGGNEKIKLDFRVIIATHKNLAEEVKEGRFREDLYYRVIGLPIELPPLRERGNDVLVLAKYFVNSFCEDNNMPVFTLHPDAKEKLLQYNYPGNIRELKSVVELAAVMSNGKEIAPDDITFSSPGKHGMFTATEKTLREYNRDIIKYYLKKYDKDVLKVAKKLAIGKSTIYKMIREKEIIT